MTRRARSTATLRREANAMAPDRSTASDGWIGNPEHASRPSRHNPNNAGVVCAEDLTNDPAAGFPVHVIYRWLARYILRPLYLAGVRQSTAPEPWNNLAYFISADETAGWSTGWLWVKYRGASRHLLHGHAGVGIGPDSEPRPPYDSVEPWGIARALAPNPAPTPDPGDLTMADISQILAALSAQEAQIAALTQTVQRLTASGGGGSTFDFDGDGEDTNHLRLDVIRPPSAGDPVGEAAVVQRVFTKGAWSYEILARGYLPGSATGLMPRGRRFDFSAQRLDLSVDSYTFDPDNPGPLPRGWSVTNLPAIIVDD